MKEKLIQDVYANISELRDRIANTQKFKIGVKYFDNEKNLIIDKVDISKFLEILEDLRSENLWSLIAENCENYVSGHQTSLKEFANEIEKLLIEIDKIPILMQDVNIPKKNLKQVEKEKKETQIEAIKEVSPVTGETLEITEPETPEEEFDNEEEKKESDPEEELSEIFE